MNELAAPKSEAPFKTMIEERVNLLNEMRSRLSGNYIVLSSQNLYLLKRDNEPEAPTSIPVSQDLLSKCVFITQNALWSRRPDEYRAGISRVLENAKPTFTTPNLFLELYRNRFLKKDEIVLSTDLVDLLCPPDDDSKPQNLLKTIQDCVFVSKSVFDPQNRARFTYEVTTSDCRVRSDSSKLNRMVVGVERLISEDQTLQDEHPDDVMDTIYSIGRQ